MKEKSMLKNWTWPSCLVAIGLIYFFMMGRGAEVIQAPMVTSEAGIGHAEEVTERP
jgi:hypothetical protein